MGITLSTTTRAATLATSHSVGGETFSLSSGNKVQIRDNETGEILTRFEGEVPAGKKWVVTVEVAIAETDA